MPRRIKRRSRKTIRRVYVDLLRGSSERRRKLRRIVRRVRTATVLVVDDDADIRGLVRTLLEKEGATVFEAPDGRTALREFHARDPDLVVLDVSMPELDGWAVLERIRDLADVPVLMLTALGQETDRVRGLQGGADDYVVKPFGRQELVARVQSLLRRARQAAGATEQEKYADGYLAIDFATLRVSVGEREVTLTPLEFKLLTCFVRNPRQVLSRDQLLELVWGGTVGIGAEQVKLYVGYLRRKLEPGAPDSVPIRTVRGFGYRYEPA
jgi:DNA-binding response OmpR family regulator